MGDSIISCRSAISIHLQHPFCRDTLTQLLIQLKDCSGNGLARHIRQVLLIWPESFCHRNGFIGYGLRDDCCPPSSHGWNWLSNKKEVPQRRFRTYGFDLSNPLEVIV